MLGKLNRSPRKLPRWLLLLIPLAFMGLFFYTPLVMIFERMLDVIATDGLGSGNASRTIWRAFRFTVWQASLSTLLTLLLGLPAAYLFARFRFPGKRLFSVLFILPFILPTVVVVTAFTATLGAGGWVNKALMAIFQLDKAPLNLLNSLWAILLVHVFYNVSIIIRVVGASWSQLDQRTMHAARVLGASPLRTFVEVTLPLLRPAILAATLLVFLFDFASFGVVLMLGGAGFATLEVEIYIQALHLLNLPLAAVLSAVQLVSTLVLMLLYQRLQSGESIPLLPRVNNENAQKPTTLVQKLFVSGLLLSLLIFLTLPLVTLVLRSVQYTARGDASTVWTLQFYQELFINRRGSLFYVPPIEAVKNSLIYAGITMGFSIFLGFQIAYAFEKNTSWSRWLETAVMLPLGSSPITLGLGYLLIFSRPPWTDIDFPILIPIAHTLVALPMVVRTLQPALRSIPRNLRDSAGVLGASPLQRWLQIDLPILSKAALTAGIFAFTVSLGEFGATSFLARPENPTMPTAIYRFFAQPGSMNFGQAMAMSVILLVICGGSIFVIELLEK
ncbi:MAG: iron ABC transporter permease [Anaerolineae bacterium]|jgi:thiamine transport system permease protein|nr:iron ABC transporter permease [Anaerolineae bacterium]